MRVRRPLRSYFLTKLEDRLCPTVTNTMDYDRPFNPQDIFTYPIPGSLRYELAAAMTDYVNNGVTDTITFDTKLAGQTINLLYGSLEINHPVVIRAPKVDPNAPPGNYDYVTLQWSGYSAANGIGMAGYGSDWSVFSINTNFDTGSVSLGGLRITNGKAAEGAGINYSGNGGLGISSCEVSGNHGGGSQLDPSTGSTGVGLYANGLPDHNGKIYGPTIDIDNSYFLNNLTGQNDSSDPKDDVGGAMWLGAGVSLAMDSSVVTGNFAENGAGGIFFSGDAAFYDSQLDGHPRVHTTRLGIGNCTISGNTSESLTGRHADGGALVIADETIGMISNTTFDGNVSSGSGGAIFMTGLNGNLPNIEGTPYRDLIGQVNVVGCTLKNNSCAGPKLDPNDPNGGQLIIETGYGGGIYMEGLANELYVVDSTLSANMVGAVSGKYSGLGKGGAIGFKGEFFYYEHKIIVNKNYDDRSISVVLDQTDPDPNGPPFPGRSLLEIDNCTIAENSAAGTKDINNLLQGGRGGGIAALRDTANFEGMLFFTSTIVAKNTVPAIGIGPDLWASDDSSGSVNAPGRAYDSGNMQYDKGYNLVGIADSGNLFLSVSNSGTLAAPLDPLLHPLAYNGGLTKTYAIGWNSPAYEMGSNSILSGSDTIQLSNDQRGELRIRAKNADIGAYEATGFAVEFPTIMLVSTPSGGTTTVTTVYATQRSLITYLDVYMDPLATGETLHVYHASYNSSNGQYTPDTELPIHVDTTVNVYYTPWAKNVTQAHITFQPSAFTYQLLEQSLFANSLNDGRYVITVSEPAVAFPGITHVVPDSGFWRLFGDVIGDAFDGTNDFAGFRMYYNGMEIEFSFDYDGDGVVSTADFLQFRLRFNTSI
jgi:predicted outer membrane repeat protein